MRSAAHDCYIVRSSLELSICSLSVNLPKPPSEAISYTWANEVCAGDNEERAFVISSMNGMQYAVAAWLPILIFPQTMAPTFRKYR